VNVAVPVAPLAWPARALLGDRADVTVLVPPGASPHGAELSPSGAVALDRADVLIFPAHGDGPAAPPDGSDPRLVIVGPRDGDGHPWLDPVSVRSDLGTLAAALDQLGIPHEPPAEALREMEKVRPSRQRAKAAAKGKDILVLTEHDAWRGFFAAMGVTGVIPLRHSDSDTPSAGEITAAAHRARSAELVLVVSPPGGGEPWLEDLARRVGGVVVELDPVGSMDWPGDMVARYDAVARAIEGAS